jgi:hypothetical protein
MHEALRRRDACRVRTGSSWSADSREEAVKNFRMGAIPIDRRRRNRSPGSAV